jgi:hypothetical protein
MAGVESGRLQSRRHHGGHGDCPSRAVPAAPASRHGCGERTFPRRVIEGGISVEGAAKPVDSQEHHKENGDHQGGFGDF